jgi:predicted Rossmann fold nucleotide-binding protein DprA/Smf involved in DNA uptake
MTITGESFETKTNEQGADARATNRKNFLEYNQMSTTSFTPDAHALIMACSYVGLNPKGDLSPLTLKEWNTLAAKLVQSRLKTPGAMLGLSAEALQGELELSLSEAQRLAALLERGAAAAIELENLLNAGIRLVTRADEHYPLRLKEKLKAQAPPVLFYAGPLELAQHEGVAIVGSRAVDEAGTKFTAILAELCAQQRLSVISGGAKGVDLVSMKTVLENGGKCVGVMSDSLAKKIREREAREYLFEERLLLLSPFHPNAPFHVANAMSRNKIIYALADYAVVVASDLEKGGTWAGAIENLRKGYAPMLVRSEAEAPPGNRALLAKGAVALATSELEQADLRMLFTEKGSFEKNPNASPVQQLGLFEAS